ncbi:T9SS type A sorting domain-containing protein [Chryseobacterium chendengshani]|uniref:T9SS type A sorting domain-containing protein n=1 Tax=Chryseobacterium sp. LJ756 TaxID=2864113 RepID=UPI001C64404D|nr:T9SS type A sorting domain-containing protein [Chryseobacterium sp. LJ756]MBW7676600.1 T9SS type A sorting domain-containing protein [Chryseobacterium sp. LJ756]
MNLKLQKLSKMSAAFLMTLFSVWSWGQTAYLMSSGDKTWDLSGTWTVSGNTYTGTDANNWQSVGISGTGNEVTSGTRTTKSSATITTTTSGGLQKPSGTIQFLSTGSSATPEAVAIDLLLNFTGRKAETLSFDWAAIDNSNGTRPTSLRVFWSTNGTTFTELSAAQLLDKVSNNTGSITSIALPPEFNNTSTARIRFYNHAGTTATGSGNRDKFQIDNISVTSSILPPTWDGSQWVGGTPTASTDAVIAGNYNGAGFTAQSVMVNSTFTLTINSGQTVTTGNLTNNGAVIVNDGGNLIQTATGTYSGAGTFTVNKSGASAPSKYAFWSSPVASQNLTSIYGVGNTPSFITEYDTATDYFVNAASTTSVVGKGYSIKTPAVANVSFAGTPNNGTQTYTLATTGSGHNLVGNPYPSNLNLDAFYTANTGRITNTFYFWDNTSNSVTTQGGTTSVNIGYATYNALTQAWAPAPNVVPVPTGNVANIGQGFFVQTVTTPTDTSLGFNNDMRVATTGTFFNKNNSSTEGKFWLRINSSYNTNNTFVVAYLSPASDAYDNYDSKAIATGSDAFYTMADAQKLLIQGKSAFDTDDVVPVGAKHFQTGNFVISLVQKEGVFNNGQAVYLHDKVAGTYTNLQNGTYSFSANSGEITNRFEIVYKLDVLATSEVEKNAFEVYKDGEDFVVRNDKNIETVMVFDAAGRKITQINAANSKLVRVKLDAKGMYILKAVSQGKEYSKKLIK